MEIFKVGRHAEMIFGLLFAAGLVGVAEAGNSCYDYYNSYQYCEHGCCGSSYNKYCCAVNFNVGLVTGCVVGGIALMIGIVVCICIYKQKHATAGRVIYPANTQGTTIFMSGQQGQQGQQQGQNMAGGQYPGMSQYPYGQPTTSFHNTAMAYPPPYPGNTDTKGGYNDQQPIPPPAY